MKLGQKYVKNLIGFLEDLKTPKIQSEINWPLYLVSWVASFFVNCHIKNRSTLAWGKLRKFYFFSFRAQRKKKICIILWFNDFFFKCMHGKRRLKKFVNQETEICILYTAMFQIFPTSTESSCNFCVTLGPSMSYYPVFISILSKFDPNWIKCCFFKSSQLYPDFIQSFEKTYWLHKFYP